MEKYTISDIGRKRTINEDSFSNYVSDDFLMSLISDGMGGHNAGDLASKMASESVRSYIIDNYKKVEDDNFSDLLKKAAIYANNLIYDKSKTDESLYNMGTTLVACIVYKKKLYILNVGDSRLYVYNNKDLSQITRDHSLVFDLVENGIISKEEARFYPGKNKINRALGTQEGVEVDLFEYSLSGNEIILLCSDGLTNMVSDETIYDVITSRASAKDMCDNLVYIANENGGYDNITLTIIQLQE